MPLIWMYVFASNTFIWLLSCSGNQDHAPDSELYKRSDINVKYSIFATVERCVLFCVRRNKSIQKLVMMVKMFEYLCV